MAPGTRKAPDTRYVAALAALSISTGALDAVSYLALDRVFTGNMTGNVIFLAFGLVGAGELPVTNLLVALLAFVVGAALAAIVLRALPSPHRAPGATFAVLGAVVLVTSVVATLWLVEGELSVTQMGVATGALALALGAQAAALKPVGIRDISTVVVTMTLVNLSSEGVLTGRKDPLWRRRLLALLAMGVGALIGALIVVHVGGAVATYVAAAVMLGGTGLLALARRGEASTTAD